MTLRRVTLRQIPVSLLRPRSLRHVLWVGIVLSVLLSVGAFAAVVGRVVAITEDRMEMNQRLSAALSIHDDRISALSTERDARNPSAYEAARSREASLAVALVADLESDERAAIDEAERALDHAIEQWRIAGATAPFSDVVEAGDRLRDDIERYRHAAYLEDAASLRLAILCGIVLGLLDIVFSIAMVVWVLRRTATPLERLSAIAESGSQFPVLAEDVGIREVDALAHALHRLDVAVRDKEQRLGEAHAEAVDLMRFGEHVQQVVDEDELHDVLARRLGAITHASALHTLTWASTTQDRLEIAYASDGERTRVQLPILSEPMRCRAVRTLKPVMGDSAAPTACRCPLAPAGGSYLCEPLLAAGELVGVVNMQSDGPGRFNQRLERRARASLGFGATALASLRLLASTRERALRDPLTGAYNRAFLTEYLNRQLAQAERSSRGLGVMVVDLDHFKHLNDTFGHAAGDRALVAAVDAIQREVRSADVVVRHGGEELVVVLADTDLEGARDAAERVRSAIAAIELSTDQGVAQVRASIGVSAFPDHGRDEAALLAAADRALYHAKESGRNRVVAAEVRSSVVMSPLAGGTTPN